MTRPVRVSAALLLVCAAACGALEDGNAGGALLHPPPGLGLQPVPTPDFTTMEPGVEAQMRGVHDALRARIDDSGATARELSRAYGEMASLLMAARDLRTAEPYYRNALALDPSDRRWAYYLGHLYRNLGPLAEAAASFEHARQLDPNDVATLVWLGDAYLALGRPDEAQPLFGRAVELDPASAAAWYGAGRAALASGELRPAVEALEQALALHPGATAIHYPLGLAWRGLGEMERAERHLAIPGTVEAQPADPLMTALDDLLESASAYEARGRFAFDAGQWAAAADGRWPSNPGTRGSASAWAGPCGAWAIGGARRINCAGIRPRGARVRRRAGHARRAPGREWPRRLTRWRCWRRRSSAIRTRRPASTPSWDAARPDEALAEYARVPELDPARPDAAFGAAMNGAWSATARRGSVEEAADAFPEQVPASRTPSRCGSRRPARAGHRRGWRRPSRACCSAKPWP